MTTLKVGTPVWLATDTDPDAPGGVVTRRPASDAQPPDDGMVYVRWPNGSRWEYEEDLTVTRPT